MRPVNMTPEMACYAEEDRRRAEFSAGVVLVALLLSVLFVAAMVIWALCAAGQGEILK